MSMKVFDAFQKIYEDLKRRSTFSLPGKVYTKRKRESKLCRLVNRAKIYVYIYIYIYIYIINVTQFQRLNKKLREKKFRNPV